MIFTLPGGFFFGVVAPLYFEELDTPGPGGSIGFLQDTDGYFRIGQVIIDLDSAMVDVFENFRLPWDFQAFAQQRDMEHIVYC